MISESDKRRLKALGYRIRQVREAKGWSQEELGFQSKLHRTYIGDIERGERNISAVNIFKVVRALQVHPAELFEK